MSFGRNPYVAKAEAAELKATSAKDSIAAEQAWREAAHLWERAAERETDEKRRANYADKAELARAHADTPAPPMDLSLADIVNPKSAKTPNVLN